MSTNKIALITGGSRGLGKNTALKMAAKGIDVIITYRTKKEEADEVVNQIELAGQTAAALQLDTSKVNTFEAFKQAAYHHSATKNGTEAPSIFW
jgi:NAD(P)-dependent dehydrogenase (short-subunit alcohol dehydrogenase family)